MPVPTTHPSGAVKPRPLSEKADNAYAVDIDESITIDIAQEANKLFYEISDWKEGDYVAVRFDRQWFPGKTVALRDFKNTKIHIWSNLKAGHCCQTLPQNF